MNKNRAIVCTWVIILFIGITNFECFAKASDIVINRVSSTYSESSAYANSLKKVQNCYGYATQIYSFYYDTGVTYYKQQPGEFTLDSITFPELVQAHADHAAISSSAYLEFIDDCLFADFGTLNAFLNNEWTIEESTATATVPSGYRKIALVIKRDVVNNIIFYDYHFYMRHDDGTWSHKPGTQDITNLSFETNEIITDSNLNTTLIQHSYNEGTRFYIIKKSAVVDYPHNNGHGDNCYSTQFIMRDEAGDVLKKSALLQNTSKEGRIDYGYDVDCYQFTPSVSRIYTIAVADYYMGAYDLELEIYSSNGTMIDYDTGAGDPSISIYLYAGTKYFFKIFEYDHLKTRYTITVTN